MKLTHQEQARYLDLKERFYNGRQLRAELRHWQRSIEQTSDALKLKWPQWEAFLTQLHRRIQHVRNQRNKHLMIIELLRLERWFNRRRCAANEPLQSLIEQSSNWKAHQWDFLMRD